MTEARWAAPCRPIVAVAADAQCQLTAVEASAEAAHLRMAVVEVMRHPTEAAVEAVTSPVEAEATLRPQAVAVATAEAATTAVEAITVTKT